MGWLLFRQFGMLLPSEAAMGWFPMEADSIIKKNSH
jgi:hypothetical protein